MYISHVKYIYVKNTEILKTILKNVLKTGTISIANNQGEINIWKQHNSKKVRNFADI